MEQFFYDWGYGFLIVSALIEGEILLLIAGSLAYHGFFQLPVVMLFAFVGAIIHDQLLYWVGHFGGNKILDRWESLRKKSQKAFALLSKYNTLLILGFRFVYGIRTITPIIVGASGVPQKKYALLTVFAAAIWAVVISSLGYWFAGMVEVIQQRFHSGQKIIALVLLGVAVLGFLVYYFTKKRKKAVGAQAAGQATPPSSFSVKNHNESSAK